MTNRQKAALDKIREGEISGHCFQYVWKFSDGRENYTKEVLALEKKHLVSITYYSGGRAGVSISADKERVAA